LPKVGIPIKNGTLAALAMSYLNSTAFNDKRPETRRSERGIVHKLTEQYGSGRVTDLKREQVQRIVDKKAATPSAARNLLAVMRVLMSHAVKIGMRKDNPAVGVTRPKIKTTGYRTWGEEHIAAYRAWHPVATRERLAIELLINTGQRRGDVVRMGRQHIRDGVLYVCQQKTGEEVSFRSCLSCKLH
jgi:integrase